MRLRVHKYELTVCYKKVPEMDISDALSRASLPMLDHVMVEECLIYQLETGESFTKEFEGMDHANGISISDEYLGQN